MGAFLTDCLWQQIGAEDVEANARGGLPTTPKLLTKIETDALKSKVAERTGAKGR